MPFIGDWRKEHHPRRAFARIILGRGLLEKLVQIIFEFWQSIRTVKRFIEPKEGENDIGAGLFEPFIRRTKTIRPMANGDLVAGHSKISEDQVQSRISIVDEGLEPSALLKTISQGVPDQDHMISLMKIELRPAPARRRSLQPRTASLDESIESVHRR